MRRPVDAGCRRVHAAGAVVRTFTGPRSTGTARPGAGARPRAGRQRPNPTVNYIIPGCGSPQFPPGARPGCPRAPLVRQRGAAKQRRCAPGHRVAPRPSIGPRALPAAPPQPSEAPLVTRAVPPATAGGPSAARPAVGAPCTSVGAADSSSHCRRTARTARRSRARPAYLPSIRLPMPSAWSSTEPSPCRRPPVCGAAL